MHGATEAKNAVSRLHLTASYCSNKGVQNYFCCNIFLINFYLDLLDE